MVLVLALAVALTLAEWLRGHLFSGFPWNAYGYALISPLWLAQGAALIGIWGRTFLAVGKVDEATYEVGRSYVVVDTGPWIFGKKVMLPAGTVRGIDETEEIVFVNRTKDQIKHAPEYDEAVAQAEELVAQLEAEARHFARSLVARALEIAEDILAEARSAQQEPLPR